MNTNHKQHQPIGYWLNRADQALTERMNLILQTHGLTRVGWQVLNVLRSETGQPEAQVFDVLQANASRTALSETIAHLSAKGWIVRVDDPADAPAPILKLTHTGRDHHARVQEPITQFRQQSLRGITAEEYQLAIGVLERIIQNVAQA